jgi:hypothetical protein
MSEMPTLSRGRRFRLWIALLLPPVAWYGFEVGLASVLKVSCTPVGSWLGVVWGLASVLACAVATGLAWHDAHGGERTTSRPWLAWIALLLSGVFALAIAFQTLGVLIVPSCVR